MTSLLVALAGILQSQSVDVDKLIKTLDTAVPQQQRFSAEGQKKLDATVQDALKDHNFDNVGIDGIAKLAESGYLGMLMPLRKAVSPRLMVLSNGDKPENARASVFCASFSPDAGSDKAEGIESWVHCIKHALAQPALPGLLKDDASGAGQIFSVVQEMDPKELGKAKPLPSFYPLLKAPMTESAAVSSVGLVDAALEPSSKTSPKDLEETRTLVKAAFDKYALPGATGATATRKLKYYKSVDEYLSGAATTGRLIGHEAPNLRFTWSNTGSIDNLGQLKGKVVVLDFWATWCGPCVRSFPNVRKIQERYKDSPVVILGVTSLQGYHMDRVAKKRIDTKDNPTLEYSLMPGFIKDQNMTWNVAFSTTGCFDPNFGVRGIPHMAIVDSKGVVRYNLLRPYDDPSEEAAKIDGLLKEAGLPVPATPMEKGNWAIH